MGKKGGGADTENDILYVLCRDRSTTVRTGESKTQLSRDLGSWAQQLAAAVDAVFTVVGVAD